MPKKTLLITLLIVILTAGLAAAGLYIGKQLSQPKKGGQETTPEHPVEPQETVSEITSADIDTSDWKTYRNDEYEFDVKYPKDAHVRETVKGGDIIIGKTTGNGLIYGVIIKLYKSNLLADQWYENFYIRLKKKVESQGHELTTWPKKGEYITINNLRFYKVPQFAFDSVVYHYYLSYNGKIYEIKFRYYGPNDKNADLHLRIHNYMLSSLRFLD
ncbi:hypothetical protein ES703_23999 [subsurface metagenome]